MMRKSRILSPAAKLAQNEVIKLWIAFTSLHHFIFHFSMRSTRASRIIPQKQNAIEKLSRFSRTSPARRTYLSLSLLSYIRLFTARRRAECIFFALFRGFAVLFANRKPWETSEIVASKRSAKMIFTAGSRNKLVNFFFMSGIICSLGFITRRGASRLVYTSTVHAARRLLRVLRYTL